MLESIISFLLHRSFFHVLSSCTLFPMYSNEVILFVAVLLYPKVQLKCNPTEGFSAIAILSQSNNIHYKTRTNNEYFEKSVRR